MIRIGTLCYVVTSCLASPASRCAVGKIVEVVSLPYEAPDWTYLPGIYYDVRFEERTFYCRSDKLRPISDPDVNIDDADDNDLLAAEIRIIGPVSGDLLTINGSLPLGIVATAYNPLTGVLRLDGLGFHSA